MAPLRIHGGSRPSLVWTWRNGPDTLKGDFGNPLGSSSYTLCVYDETLGNPTVALASAAPAAGSCGRRPCWKEDATGHAFSSRAGNADGLARLRLHSGLGGTARIGVIAGGSHFAAPLLPFPQDQTVTVQLKRDDDNVRWGATYTTHGRNTPKVVSAQSD
jgi:hypothetical protein